MTQILVRDHRTIEHRGRKWRILQRGQTKVVERILPSTTLHLDQPQTIQRFGISVLKFEGRAIGFFGFIEPVRAKQRGPQTDPAVDCAWLKQGITAELVDGRG